MSFKVFIKIVAATFTAIVMLLTGTAPAYEGCMIAHRGYSGKYMENTEMAFVEAAKHGSGGAETDIRMTKDGVYVTSHNGDITLKDGTVLNVAESTYEELTAQPLKNKKTKDDVYLCTYERYLEVMRDNDMVCFIELKGSFSDEQVKEIFDIAAEVYDLSKCILQSFDFDNLLKARALFPELPLMLTYGQGDTGYERCFDYGISIDADFNVLTEDMVKEFHDRGLEVGAWTCNTFAAVSYAKSLGVDYIESDKYGG